MEQQLKIQRLEATIEKMKQLKPEQFHYADYVHEWDHRTGCGTVCCVGGWYPQWFPESGLIYFGAGMDLRFRNGEIADDAEDGLQNWHGLESNVINYLFYGGLRSHNSGGRANQIPALFPGAPDSHTRNGLPQVIRQFEFILQLLKENKL